jgi:hypothetical protein
MGFEIMPAISMLVSVFWVVTPRGTLTWYHRFEGTFRTNTCSSLKGDRPSFAAVITILCVSPDTGRAHLLSSTIDIKNAYSLLPLLHTFSCSAASLQFRMWELTEVYCSTLWRIKWHFSVKTHASVCSQRTRWSSRVRQCNAQRQEPKLWLRLKSRTTWASWYDAETATACGTHGSSRWWPTTDWTLRRKLKLLFHGELKNTQELGWLCRTVDVIKLAVNFAVR